MDDGQTCPEHVLLLAMERAFRGPEYKNAQTLDWQPHMKRVLKCVRENDPLVIRLRAESQARLDAIEYLLNTGIFAGNDAEDAQQHAMSIIDAARKGEGE